MNSEISTLLLVLAPSALVLVASYMVLRRMLDADQRRRQVELRVHSHGETLKIRLQAIEQLVVLMEQLSPTDLVLRTTRHATTVMELQSLMLETVRKEMVNYLQYQLYVGLDTWQLVVSTRNNLHTLINQSAAELPPDASAIQLSKKIIDAIQQEPEMPNAEALEALRKEAQRLFV